MSETIQDLPRPPLQPRPLLQPRPPLLPQSLTLDDIDDVNRIKPDDWADLSAIHRFYVLSEFCKPIKISVDGKLAGIGTAICYGTTAWLAHIIVAKEFRNRGFGSLIVSFLKDYLLRDCSCQSITLTATDMGFPVYAKLGFSLQSEYVTLVSDGVLRTQEISERVVRMSESDLPDVLGLDREISGELRASILRPFIGDAYVCKSGRSITGYYLPGLGEGAILATDAQSGIELLKLKAGTKSRIVMPKENEAGIDFLKANDFRETISVRRMLCGNEFAWKPRNIFSRIGGFAG